MPFERPTNLLAGFIAVHPDPSVPELLMAGEQWAPQTKAIAEHSHGVWEFYYQVSGCSVWRVGRRVVRLAPSGLLVIPPGLRHSLPASQESEQHYLFAALDLNQIAARIGSEVIQVYHRDHPQLVPSAGEARNAFQNLMRELTILRDWRSRALQLSVDALVIEIGRCLHGGGFRKMEMHPAIHRAVGLMEQEPEQPWNTTALARRAGVSIPHLNALFQKYLRTTPHAFLLNTRLERSKELLLRRDLPITQIAIELGFCSGQHFAAAFRRKFGCTPREFATKARSGSK